jgi:hypothetical protein
MARSVTPTPRSKRPSCCAVALAGKRASKHGYSWMGVVRDCCSCGSRGSRTRFDWSVSLTWLATNAMAVFWGCSREGGLVHRCRGSALTTMIDWRWNSNGVGRRKYRQNLPWTWHGCIDEVGALGTITKPRELEG